VLGSFLFFTGILSTFGQTTIFSENVGSPSGTTKVGVYTGWQNQGTLVFDSGQVASSDVRTTSASSTYAGASGSGNVFFTGTSGSYGLSIEGINAATFSNIQLTFGYRKESPTVLPTFSVDYWNGSSWVTIENTAANLFNQTASAATGWYLSKTINFPSGTQINGLKIRFVKSGTQSIRLDDIKLVGTPSSSISVSSATLASALTSTYGTASSAQTVTVTGSGLTANIVATSPNAAVEVSSNGTTYGSTASFVPTSNTVNGTLYVRLAASAAVGNYNNVSISLTSTNATSRTVATTGSGNTISTKNLTISGVSADNKTYDNTNAATLSGTPTLVGIVGSDVVSLTGTPTATFAQSFIGTNVAVSVSGYSLTGTSSSNYTLTQPSLSADITAKNLTINGISIADKNVDGNTNATIVGTPSLVGVISGDAVSLSGNPVAQFTSSAVGTNIPVNVSGYVLSGGASGNYSLTQPTGLTASIIDTAKQNQTISFGTLSGVTYGDAPFNLTATASSGLSVVYSSSNANVATVSGNTVTIVGPGTTTITADQSGNSTYNAANPVGQTLSVAVKTLTVSGASAQNKVYDGTTSAIVIGTSLNGIVGSDNVNLGGGGTFASANVGTGIAVTANLTLVGTDASKYALTQPTGLSADITKATQTINFPALAAKNSTDAPFTLSATATSGLSVSFASLDTNMLKISGTTATIASYGTVTIAATQLGNNNYDSASTVYQTLTINRVASTIAAWEVNGLTNYGPSPFTPGVSDTNLTITGLSRGSGIGVSGTAAGNAWGGSGPVVSTKAAATSGNSFWSFTVSPKANRKVSFSMIDTIWIRRPNSGHNAGQWQYQINNNGFVDFGPQLAFVRTGSATVRDTIAPINMTSIAALQNIEEGTTVTLRLVLWGASSATGTTYIVTKTGNDLIVNGFVEPNFKPTLVVPNVNFSAFNQTTSTPTSTQSFTVNGQYLTSDVGIKAPAGFEVSDNATSNFSDSLTLPVNSGLVTNGPVTIYVRLNASNLGSYAGNINITSTGATSKTVAVNGVRSGVFYSKASGNLQDLSTWGFNTDGTGTSPLNFTTGGATYVLTNRASVVLDTLLTISGTSSKMIIGDSVNAIELSISSNGGLTGNVDLNANAKLVMESSVQPTIGTQGTNATLEYKNISATIAAGNYKNLTLTGTGTKTFGGGTINIAGNLIFDNVTINGGNPSFSTLNVGGNVTYLGTVTPPATANSITLNFTDTSGATKTIDAAGNDVRWFRISVPTNATVDVQNATKVWVGNASGGGLNVANNGTLKLNSADLELFPSTSGSSAAFVFNTSGKLATTDSTDVYLARAANANLGTLRFDSTSNVIGNLTLDLSGTTNKSLTLGSNLKITGSVQLNNGTLIVGNNQLTLAGSSLTNTNGKISVDSATLVFENSNNLSLNRSIFAANVNHVRMNSTADVTLTSNLNIQGNLTFDQGLMTVVDSQVTVVGSILGGNASSYFKSTGLGKLKKSLTNGVNQNFPVGNSAYNPVQITNNTGNTDEFSVRVLDEVYVGGTSGAPSIKDRVKRTWDISKATANGGSGVDFTFFWNGGSEESGTLSNPVLNHFNSSTGKWEMPTVAVSNFVSGTSVTFSGYSGTFSPFGIGNGSGLPVTWLHVKGMNQDQNSLISWSTASEEGNDYFEIERSLDGKTFETIGQVKSKGSLGGQYTYSDMNASIIGSTLYYRIKQIDYNGASTYSIVVAVTFNKNGVMIGSVYPNPVNDFLNANITTSKSEIATISILDLTGKLIYQETKSFSKGSSNIQISTQDLPYGIYFLKVFSNGIQSLEKFSK